MVEKATAAELPSGIGLHHVHVLAGAVHVVFLAYYLLDRTWVAAQFFIEAAVVGHRILRGIDLALQRVDNTLVLEFFMAECELKKSKYTKYAITARAATDM